MKFIEVTTERSKMILNIEEIEAITRRDGSRRTTIITKKTAVEALESYEEIKKLLKEAVGKWNDNKSTN